MHICINERQGAKWCFKIPWSPITGNGTCKQNPACSPTSLLITANNSTSRSKETSTALECTCTSSQGLAHRDANMHNTHRRTHTYGPATLSSLFIHKRNSWDHRGEHTGETVSVWLCVHAHVGAYVWEKKKRAGERLGVWPTDLQSNYVSLSGDTN